MNPTKEETEATLARIQVETDQVFFRDLGNHNRAIARERIADRARRLDEIQSANHAQMFNAVKGGDKYDFHRSGMPWRLIFLAIGLFLIGYAVLRSI